MNVDIDNFHEVREMIEKSKLIERSQFISYDVQFTGLNESGSRIKSQNFPFERYKKMAAIVTKYNIIQLGLTFFVMDGQKFVAYPFNFYLFPRQNSIRDPIVTLQGSCMEYNTNHQMNWNRWIIKGITYVKLSEKQQLLEPIDHSRFDEFFDNAQENVQVIVQNIIEIGNKLTSKDKVHQMQISKKIFTYVKKLIDFYIEKSAANFLTRINKQKLDHHLLQYPVQIYYISHEDRKIAKEAEVQNILGFTMIFQKIWNSKKLLVGHNCFFDIMYIYQAFINPLPVNYSTFKQQLNLNGRKFIDTKIITQLYDHRQERFPHGTSLQEIYTYLIKNQNKIINDLKMHLAPQFKRYALDNLVLHEAGYDSYLTGWVYFQLSKKFAQTNKLVGRISVVKSYYNINLNQPDTINNNYLVFVVSIARQSQFIVNQQLWKLKKQRTKEIKQYFKIQNISNDVIIRDGFKQIFLEVKQRHDVANIMKKLVKIKKQKHINITSLSEYILQRGQYIGDKS